MKGRDAGGAQNHWFDCLVGSAVTAAINGAVLYGTDLQQDSK